MEIMPKLRTRPYTNIRVTSRKVASTSVLQRYVEQRQLPRFSACALRSLSGLAACLGIVQILSCREREKRWLDVQSRSHIQQKGAIRADVTVDEGHEPSEVFGRHPPHPFFFAEHAPNHQRIGLHTRFMQI